MPAVQVRDFPEELYEELKAYAAKNHRSVAQQLIVATEQMLHPSEPFEPFEIKATERQAPFWSDGSEQERKARIEKRKTLFAQIDADIEEAKQKGTWGNISSEEIVSMVREGREERLTRILAAVGLPIDEEGAFA